MSHFERPSWRAGDALHDARLEALGRRLGGVALDDGDGAIGFIDVADPARLLHELETLDCKVLVLRLAETDGDAAPLSADDAAAVARVRGLPVPIVGVVGGTGSDPRVAALADACDVRVAFGRPFAPPGDAAVHKATEAEAAAAAIAWARRLAAAPPPARGPAALPAAPRDDVGDNIPRVAWTFWADGAAIPDLVKRCVFRFQELNPAWSVRAVTLASLPSLLRPGERPPPRFRTMAAAQKSDWVRLYLLSRYGGVWLDASVILLRPLDGLVQRKAADFVGYYMAGWNSRPDVRVVESWFLAAPPGSPFLRDWFDEFDAAARKFADTDAYLAHVLPKLDLAKFPPQYMAYLVVHVAAQAVLQAGGEGRYDLALSKAQDGPFYVASKLVHWNDALLADYLCAETETPRHVPFVKLTGKMRGALLARLDRGPRPAPGSLVGGLYA